MWQHQIESLQPFLELALFCYKDICNSSWKLELRYINKIETLQSNLGAYTFMTSCMDIACCPVVYVQLLNCVWLFANPWTAACQASLSFTVSQNLLRFMSIEMVMPSNHVILLLSSPLAFNLSQHQGIFQWVSFLYQIAKVLALQLQHQSSQWIFRVDSL